MLQFIILSLSNGALAMTLSKSQFFRASRAWIASKSSLMGELVNCPYCMLHWLAALSVVVWHMRLVDCGVKSFDYVASWLALIGSSALVGGLIFRLFTPPTVRTQDLEALLRRSVKFTDDQTRP